MSTYPNIEPEASAAENHDKRIQLSIAISLKRIADELSLLNRQDIFHGDYGIAASIGRLAGDRA